MDWERRLFGICTDVGLSGGLFGMYDGNGTVGSGS